VDRKIVHWHRAAEVLGRRSIYHLKRLGANQLSSSEGRPSNEINSDLVLAVNEISS